jgi:hypothetical protein
MISGMKGCPDCELALDLEEVREAELYVLTPEERRAVRVDEALLQSLLDRISERRYSLA